MRQYKIKLLNVIYAIRLDEESTRYHVPEE